jgi:ATP-binding cassette subfamily B protein
VSSGLDGCELPIARAGEALDALARTMKLRLPPIETPSMPESAVSDHDGVQARWVDAAAATLGLDVEPIEAAYADVDRFLRAAPPALLRVRINGAASILAVHSVRFGRVAIVAPDLSVRRLPRRTIRDALCEPIERKNVGDIDALLDEIQVGGSRRAASRAALLRDRLATTAVASGWIVRLPAGASVRAQGWLAGLWRRLAVLVVAHACAYTLWILSWWVLGRAAIDGRLDRAVLLAWALLLITIIPFELLVTWLQGRLSIDGGALLKRRLMLGAVRLEPEEIRHEGAGQLLGRVLESQAIEALALSGGFLALVAAVELTLAAVVLATVAPAIALLLPVCGAAGLALGWSFFIRRRGWTQTRLEMTHGLVERIVGHRTRLAQEPAADWHVREDSDLERYLLASREMDRATAVLTVLPRGWLLIGVAALSVPFVSGSASSASLAVVLGGILLGYRALKRFTTGVSSIAGAAIAWTQAAPIFRAATRRPPIGSPAVAIAAASNVSVDAAADGRALVDGHELSFRYRDDGEPVLDGCTLRVRRGDRLLLEGPSGGGKSTLASLLTGLRTPQSGLLLLNGLDRHTLGVDGWRRRIVAAPQFHENHVFMGTFLFNLLMGGEWPPQVEDVDRAERLCRDLGLGDLLDRMPAGLLQQVGETGWQLSHGERTRLFIARALLQRADFVVLDESFAQLDPENLHRTLRCVLDRAPTLMVIAHP